MFHIAKYVLVVTAVSTIILCMSHTASLLQWFGDLCTAVYSVEFCRANTRRALDVCSFASNLRDLLLAALMDNTATESQPSARYWMAPTAPIKRFMVFVTDGHTNGPSASPPKQDSRLNTGDVVSSRQQWVSTRTTR